MSPALGTSKFIEALRKTIQSVGFRVGLLIFEARNAAAFRAFLFLPERFQRRFHGLTSSGYVVFSRRRPLVTQDGLNILLIGTPLKKMLLTHTPGLPTVTCPMLQAHLSSWNTPQSLLITSLPGLFKDA